MGGWGAVGGGLCAAGWISNTLIKFADYILEVLLLRGHTFIPFLPMICFTVSALVFS